MKARSEWIAQWQTDAQANVPVIIHVDGDPKQYVETLIEKGLAVTHTFRLTQTVSANGPAQCVLDLLELSWITKIEPDQPIRTMKRGKNERK